MIKTLVCVAMGGACGALARYSVYLFLGGPLATFAVNIMGCLIAGILTALWGADHPARAFIAIGFLGAFTTFSAFSVDTISMVQTNRAILAAGYVFLTNAVSLSAAFGGFALAKVLSV